MRAMTCGMTLGFAKRVLLPPVARSARRSSSSTKFSNSPTFPAAGETMDNGSAATSRSPASNPKLSKVQSLLNEDSQGGWEKCWGEGITPWDLGKPTPVILRLVETGDLPSGTALVPGCGGVRIASPSFVYSMADFPCELQGYDVVAMASPERFVTGVDLSETAINQAIEVFFNKLVKYLRAFDVENFWFLLKQRTSESPNKEYFTFLARDFFNWQTTEQFDLIFDYTFFCAIDLPMRSAWADRIGSLLKPDGELITLMYPVDQYHGGPPFAVSVNDYEEVLRPLGFKAVSVVDNELAIEPRKGREKLGRWKRNLPQALM